MAGLSFNFELSFNIAWIISPRWLFYRRPSRCWAESKYEKLLDKYENFYFKNSKSNNKFNPMEYLTKKKKVFSKGFHVSPIVF